MHKIHEKEFTLEDFSCEHLDIRTIKLLEETIEALNDYRRLFINYDPDDFEIKGCPSKKDIWWQMIQLLPSSYNQRRTIMLNYEVLAGIYRDRNAHKLDEWREFCQWIEQLPYSEIITCESEKKLYKVGQYAEGYIEGTIELTEREAEIVERVINVKNWTVTHREDHSGIFSIEPCETEG